MAISQYSVRAQERLRGTCRVARHGALLPRSQQGTTKTNGAKLKRQRETRSSEAQAAQIVIAGSTHAGQGHPSTDQSGASVAWLKVRVAVSVQPPLKFKGVLHVKGGQARSFLYVSELL